MKIIELTRPLILATASEARRALVKDLGLEFIPTSVDIDESVLPDEDVLAYVERLARAKASAVIPSSLKDIVVAVDTAIGLKGLVIGKAADERHARDILNLLSGKTHTVSSAIVLRDIAAGTIDVEVTTTGVRFAELSKRMIDWYIETGEWKGRAGAYAIQGKGAALVEEVIGCFTNVIGISVPVLLKMLTCYCGPH